MKRREFLWSTGAACAGLALTKAVPGFADTTASSDWRTFEVTTRVEVLKPAGVTHVWLPAALVRNTPFQKTLSNQFTAEGGSATLRENQQDALGIIAGTYPADAKPVLLLTSRVSTRNYKVDLSAPQNRRDDRHREGAGDLRLGGGQHVSRSQGARLRSRRHSFHVGIR